MTEVDTGIARVVVFRDGARVTRTGKKVLQAGPQKVVVTGITNLAQEDSFRVKGKGPASLSSIDVRRTETVFEPKEDVKHLYKELQKLLGDEKALTDETQLYSVRLSNLENMMGEFAGSYGMLYAADEASIEQLTEMDDISGKMLTETRSKLRELSLKLEDIKVQIQIVQNNIGKIQSRKRTEIHYEVEVSLEVTQDSEVELELTYQCNGARWTPSYDVDLLPGEAKLRRIAMVRNQTKEDWEKVNLTISSATSRPVETVEGSPFYVSVYDPYISAKKEDRRRSVKSKKGTRARPKPSMVRPPGGPPAGAPPPEMEEEFAEAIESVSGISVYELPKPITIPFDNERHPVTLIEEGLESKTVHYWYPDGMSEVVARDEVTNGDTVILAGKVKVYSEGDYIGETTIEQQSPREEFKIGTRTAYDVKAKKKLVERQVEKAGITRGKLRRFYKYRLEIESFSKRDVEIEVKDRIPHSNSTSIEVKVDWEKLGIDDHELGIMEWQKKIQPKMKLELEYEYEVQWEKG
ncbi:MAG: mucoidy inhibitor MuiA family protein, partial [Candidatus Thorarchaeota archaeon]